MHLPLFDFLLMGYPSSIEMMNITIATTAMNAINPYMHSAMDSVINQSICQYEDSQYGGYSSPNYPYNGRIINEELGGDFQRYASTTYQNTCTIRMSHAFNMAGHPIPNKLTIGLYVTRPFVVQSPVNKFWYLVRVQQLKEYLLKRYPASSITTVRLKKLTFEQKQKTILNIGSIVQTIKEVGSQADFVLEIIGKKGIICFEMNGNGYTGHFTLWNGSCCVHGNYLLSTETYAIHLIHC
jgi:hypothetical protein